MIAEDLPEMKKEMRDAETSMATPLSVEEESLPSKLAEELAWIKNKILLLENDAKMTNIVDRRTVPLPQRIPQNARKPVITNISEISPSRKIVVVNKPKMDIPDRYTQDPWIMDEAPTMVELSLTPMPRKQERIEDKSEKLKGKYLTFKDALASSGRSGPPDGPGNPGIPDGPGGSNDPCSGPAHAPETRRKNTSKGRRTTDAETMDTSKEEDTEGWKTVEKDRKRKRKRKKVKKSKEKGVKGSGDEKGGDPPPPPAPAPRAPEKSTIQLLQKMIPKTSGRNPRKRRRFLLRRRTY